ncbi:hypothetical protein COV16_06680 [Candidatus Woesearchaeota archaeon CG10_big_fil_rev_8_21_14_0_10_34_8]|nr:MAG: hypothetical protein COV16_06680 [Candidatus Woesearchaeota archaeon CG10_big_fil_rev_8_21_14_0_10_34_8]
MVTNIEFVRKLLHRLEGDIGVDIRLSGISHLFSSTTFPSGALGYVAVYSAHEGFEGARSTAQIYRDDQLEAIAERFYDIGMLACDKYVRDVISELTDKNPMHSLERRFALDRRLLQPHEHRLKLEGRVVRSHFSIDELADLYEAFQAKGEEGRGVPAFDSLIAELRSPQACEIAMAGYIIGRVKYTNDVLPGKVKALRSALGFNIPVSAFDNKNYDFDDQLLLFAAGAILYDDGHKCLPEEAKIGNLNINRRTNSDVWYMVKKGFDYAIRFPQAKPIRSKLNNIKNCYSERNGKFYVNLRPANPQEYLEGITIHEHWDRDSEKNSEDVADRTRTKIENYTGIESITPELFMPKIEGVILYEHGKDPKRDITEEVMHSSAQLGRAYMLGYLARFSRAQAPSHFTQLLFDRFRKGKLDARNINVYQEPEVFVRHVRQYRTGS